MRRAITAGVKGLLVPGMAAEVGKLSVKEHLEIVQYFLDENNDRVKIIGGTAAHSMEESCLIAKEIINQGCHGVLVNFRFQNEEIYRRKIERSANLNPGILMIQDWDFTGYGLPVPLIQKIFENYDSFRALKIEVVPAGVNYTEVIQATENRLHVSGGWAVTQMIEGLQRGAHAFWTVSTKISMGRV